MMTEIEHILHCIAEYFNIPYDELKNSKGEKTRNYGYPRGLYFLFATAVKDVTLLHAGSLLDYDSHSQVHTERSKIRNWAKVDPSVKKDINAIWVILQKPCAYNLIKQVLQNTDPKDMDTLATLITDFQADVRANNHPMATKHCNCKKPKHNHGKTHCCRCGYPVKY